MQGNQSSAGRTRRRLRALAALPPITALLLTGCATTAHSSGTNPFAGGSSASVSAPATPSATPTPSFYFGENEVMDGDARRAHPV